MNIASIMTTPVQTIGPDQAVEEANQLMARGNFRHLPVTEGKRLIGIVSDRDLALVSTVWSKDDQHLRNYWTAGGVRVRHIMSPCPAILSPLDSVEKAIEIAVERKYGAFPVVDRGSLVGIVTTIDLLRVCLGALSNQEIHLSA